LLSPIVPHHRQLRLRNEFEDREFPTSVPSPFAPFQTEKNVGSVMRPVFVLLLFALLCNCKLSRHGQNALLQTIDDLRDISVTQVHFVRIVDSVPAESTMEIEVPILMNPMELASE
jgi:hypothetical protein